MNMSKDFMPNDFGWNQFAATGSIFDYLNYKHVDVFNYDALDKDAKYCKGGSCEDRDKRSGS